MRKFCIGDVRGDVYLLQKLLDKIGPTESDTLIFLGSYLGPGDNSKGVLDHLLMSRKIAGTWLFLRGCYEYMFLHCIQTIPDETMLQRWTDMGGEKVFRSYANNKHLLVMLPGNGSPTHPGILPTPLAIPEPHIRFMQHDLHLMFHDDTLPFIACHNGYYAGVAGAEDLPEEASLFTPNEWWENDLMVIPGKEIVYSHVPFLKPKMTAGKIGIDLGAGFDGGKLCALEMYSKNFTIVRR